jgi:hypothetical protein
MFVATLDGIFRYADLPEEYEPYVQFKATIDKRELKPNDELAILNIAGTSTHHVLFLDSYSSTDEIERELKINHSLISSCCRGKQQTAYGYKWEYKDIE